MAYRGPLKLVYKLILIHIVHRIGISYFIEILADPYWATESDTPIPPFTCINEKETESYDTLHIVNKYILLSGRFSLRAP